ncbi:ABC transporter substrate-binding protein [Propionimicrobium sp. BV2F7]|uniref:ABC transporter substrate-binding protein n=1 Tax=Propionimicrobium sp. BV2F7 TaxID=1111131 RepID=UPI000561542B|nr:ABC transporter substrate-binding protein [Propionimicrobium sp. BV2F7]
MFRKALVCLVALLLVLSGCGSNSNVAPQDRVLIVGTHTTPSTLDLSANDAAAISEALLYNVYQTLVRTDDQGQLQKLLASDYQISSDRKTYTFTLRPGAKFSSGAPVNAEAVVKSINYIINDENTSKTRKKEMAVVDSVEAKDSDTVEFKLKRPSNFWLYSMAGPAGVIYDPAALDSGDLATQPVGSGPYKLDTWLQGEEIRLIRDPGYWGTPARVAGVNFKYFADPNAMNNAMASGSIDIIRNVTAPQALGQFEKNDQYKVLEGYTNGEVVLGMNQQRELLKDLRVRQAINYAIDRQALLDAVWAGKGTLIGSMVPPFEPWFEDLSDAYPYNPEKAKELLAEAGYGDGLTLTMRVPTLPYATDSAAYISSVLSQVGITLNIEQLEFPARWIDEVMVKSNYDLTIVSHVEPRDIVRFATPDYYWHFDNEELRQVMAQADQSPEPEQIELLKKAARIISDQAGADFLWLLPNLVVTKPEIVGISSNATNLSFDLTNVAINE